MPPKSITDNQITTALWRTENPNNSGYNAKTGKYRKFKDPNGTDWLIGPGLKVGSTIEDGEYTREELNNIAASHTRKSLASIGKSFNEKYGTDRMPTPWDTVSLAPKLLMNDARYRAGTLPQSSWPSLYDAVAHGDWGKALTESRTKYQTPDNVWHPDNDRVRRNAEAYFPGAFNVTYTDGSWDPVKVTPRKKKEYGGTEVIKEIKTPIYSPYRKNHSTIEDAQMHLLGTEDINYIIKNWNSAVSAAHAANGKPDPLIPSRGAILDKVYEEPYGNRHALVTTNYNNNHSPYKRIMFIPRKKTKRSLEQ